MFLIAIKFNIKDLPDQKIHLIVNMYEQFEVVQVTPTIIGAGLDLHQTRSVSFDDANALASAQTARCSLMLSEDMNAGERFGGVDGVRVVNPFL